MKHVCPTCGSRRADVNSTCPGDVACPVCHAGPRQPCRGGTGHVAYFLHADRIREAEKLDQARGVGVFNDHGVRP